MNANPGTSVDGGVLGHRVALVAPGAKPALKRADAPDALLPEKERHTGARGLARSSTVENNLAVTRQQAALLLKFLGVDADCPGNGLWIGFEIHGMAQIHNDDILAGV